MKETVQCKIHLVISLFFLGEKEYFTTVLYRVLQKYSYLLNLSTYKLKA